MKPFARIAASLAIGAFSATVAPHSGAAGMQPETSVVFTR